MLRQESVPNKNPAVWGSVFDYCGQIPYLTQHVFLGLEDLRARLQMILIRKELTTQTSSLQLV